MTIKEAKRVDGADLTKMQRYNLTSDPAIETVQSAAGERIRPAAWMLYEDENSDGAVQEVLSFTNMEKTFATISETFKREFSRCVEVADGAAFEIEIMKGQTKNGRDFVTCRLTWVDE